MVPAEVTLKNSVHLVFKVALELVISVGEQHGRAEFFVAADTQKRSFLQQRPIRFQRRGNNLVCRTAAKHLRRGQ